MDNSECHLTGEGQNLVLTEWNMKKSGVLETQVPLDMVVATKMYTVIKMHWLVLFIMYNYISER